MAASSIGSGAGAVDDHDLPARTVRRRLRFRDQLARAVERLADSGTTYGELSVDRLVAEANMSRSSFYKYFGDKNLLLTELSEAVQADFLTAASAWLDLPAEASRDDYRAAFLGIFTAYRSHRVLMRSLVEASSEDDGFRERFEDMMTVFTTAIGNHIRRGQDTGAVASARRADDLATWLTWMLEHGQLLYVGPTGAEELDAHVEAATDVMWKSLYSRRPASVGR